MSVNSISGIAAEHEVQVNYTGVTRCLRSIQEGQAAHHMAEHMTSSHVKLC